MSTMLERMISWSHKTTAEAERAPGQPRWHTPQNRPRMRRTVSETHLARFGSTPHNGDCSGGI